MNPDFTISRPKLPRHYEASAFIPAVPTRLFEFLDDHARLVAHMAKRTWTMGGGRMVLETDAQQGRRVGSRIHLSGRAFGIPLDVREVITERAPPFRKVWQTTGVPRLLVIGHYCLGFDLRAEGNGSLARVFIDYALPDSGLARWLSAPMGGEYAKWCVQRMLRDARAHFRALPVDGGQPAASGAERIG